MRKVHLLYPEKNKSRGAGVEPALPLSSERREYLGNNLSRQIKPSENIVVKVDQTFNRVPSTPA